MYYLWIMAVMVSLINISDINNYNYQSFSLVVLSIVGCFREIYLLYKLDCAEDIIFSLVSKGEFDD